MSQKFETSKVAGKHLWLCKLAGKWKGTTKVWFEPEVLGDESPAEGTMRCVLGERFILHEYKGSLQGSPLEGIAIYGFSLTTEKFQSAWVDSFHNGTSIMFSESGKGGDFSVLGSYAYITPETEQYWGWRTEILMPDDDTVVITAYNISPDGSMDVKAMETTYHRIH
ncbi:MAG TPA: DUF1579 domain-containing protein [Flavipsychrobacter sp.]|nr:DUF1579 domain-containing protein [Flavipsychrobacter sp.]